MASALVGVSLGGFHSTICPVKQDLTKTLLPWGLLSFFCFSNKGVCQSCLQSFHLFESNFDKVTRFELVFS